MTKSDCVFERASHIGVAIALLIFASGFSVIGLTVLPVLGLLPAALLFLASFYFFRAPRSRECLIR